MNVDMVKSAMDRIEVLLKDAEEKAFMATASVSGDSTLSDLGDVQHSINSARQIAGAVKVLLDDPKGG